MTNVTSRLFFVLLGISIPSIIIGRSVLASAVLAAFVCIPFLPDRGEIWARAKGAMSGKCGLLVLFTFVVWIPSLAVSSEPLVSFTTMARSLIYILIAVFLWATLNRNPQMFNGCLITLVASTAVLATLAVIGLLGPSELIGVLRGDGWASVDARRYLKESATSGALLAPVLIWAAVRLRGKWALLCFIAVIDILVIMWVTGNRSAMAGLLAVLIVVGLMYALHKRRMKITALSLLAIVLGGCTIIGWLYFYYNPNYALDPNGLPFPIWLIDPQRQEIWAFSWNAGESNRWFGVGINVINELASAADWNSITKTRNIPLHPHNWAVEIIVETGIVGFAVMLMCIGYNVLRWARGFLASGDPALLAALGVWAAYWASSLFSVSYWSSWLQGSFVVATAVCLAGRQRQVPAPEHPG